MTIRLEISISLSRVIFSIVPDMSLSNNVPGNTTFTLNLNLQHKFVR